jgi:hypothetical protein
LLILICSGLGPLSSHINTISSTFSLIKRIGPVQQVLQVSAPEIPREDALRHDKHKFLSTRIRPVRKRTRPPYQDTTCRLESNALSTLPRSVYFSTLKMEAVGSAFNKVSGVAISVPMWIMYSYLLQ